MVIRFVLGKPHRILRFGQRQAQRVDCGLRKPTELNTKTAMNVRQKMLLDQSRLLMNGLHRSQGNIDKIRHFQPNSLQLSICAVGTASKSLTLYVSGDSTSTAASFFPGCINAAATIRPVTGSTA
jgi:hypothetical protein